MKGYVQQKSNNKILGYSSWVKRFLILDVKEYTLSIFKEEVDEKNQLIQISPFPAHLSELDVNGSSEPHVKAQPICVVDLHAIAEVTWDQDKKNGRRFDVGIREVQEAHGSNSGSEGGKKYSLVEKSSRLTRKSSGSSTVVVSTRMPFMAESKSKAAEWVNFLTAGISEARARVGRKSRKSRFASNKDDLGPKRSLRVHSLPAVAFHSSFHDLPKSDCKTTEVRESLNGLSKLDVSVTTEKNLIQTTSQASRVLASTTSLKKRLSNFSNVVPEYRTSPLAASYSSGKIKRASFSHFSDPSQFTNNSAVYSTVKLLYARCRVLNKGSESAKPQFKRIVITPLKKKLWQKINLWKCSHSFSQDNVDKYLTDDLVNATSGLLSRLGYRQVNDATERARLVREGLEDIIELSFFTFDPSVQDASSNDIPSGKTGIAGIFGRSYLIDQKDLELASQRLNSAIESGKIDTLTLMYRGVPHDDILVGSHITNYLCSLNATEVNLVHLNSPEDSLLFGQSLVERGFLEIFPPQNRKHKGARGSIHLEEFKLNGTYRIVSRRMIHQEINLLSNPSGLELLHTMNFFHFDFWLFELKQERTGLVLRQIKRGMKTFSDCFSGQDLIDWFMKSKWGDAMLESDSSSLETSLFVNPQTIKAFASLLITRGLIQNVLDSRAASFDEDAIYVFVDSLIDQPFKPNPLRKNVLSLASPQSSLNSPSVGESIDVSAVDEIKQISAKDAKRRSKAMKKFIAKVSSESFETFFLQLEDDKQILSILLHQMLSTDFFDEEILGELDLNDIEEKDGLDSSLENYSSSDLDLFKTVLLELVVKRSLNLSELLALVFHNESSQRAHGLALDVFLEFLRRQSLEMHICGITLYCEVCGGIDDRFIDFVHTCISKSNFLYSSHIARDSLLAALIDEEWSPIKPNAFNQQVLRPRLWKAYFSLVRKYNAQMMETGLQDAFCMFLDNPMNASQITRISGWQSWILQFLELSDPEYKQCKILAMNIFIRILFWLFLRSSRFIWVLIETFIVLEEFGIHSKSPVQFLQVCYDLMSGLITSLRKHDGHFPLTPSFEEICYVNLPHLLRVIEIFLFSSAQWGQGRPISIETIKIREEILKNIIPGNSTSLLNGLPIVLRHTVTRSKHILEEIEPDVEKACEYITANIITGLHWDDASKKCRYVEVLDIIKKSLNLIRTLRVTPEHLENSHLLRPEEKKVIQELQKHVQHLKFSEQIVTALFNEISKKDKYVTYGQISGIFRSFSALKSDHKRTEFISQLNSHLQQGNASESDKESKTGIL